MSGIVEFEADLNAFAEKIGEDVVDLTRAVTLKMTSELIKNTPVDTGRARSNWQHSTTQPGNIKNRDNQDKSGRPSRTSAQNLAAVLQPYQQVWISNNLPYINRLNEGHSKQAGVHFVERAVQTIENRTR